MNPTTDPTLNPTTEPSPGPTTEPTAEPTAEPTIEPTAANGATTNRPTLSWFAGSTTQSPISPANDT
eukprot:CAMPEP_0201567576 /NCGR_PEP_ID=MMETSP0190_2-20130828/8130_1 /ASSEMBLY_ACC=CAM_ASM_000263 /TAXON_ID=37353 /ORGANISM="Rosalina sp." /LENGTH=66 /DNA_ID=CAMNT_0047987723 /DNA_START=10 /DNA_END=207 /DNA_ORIENTATION=+